jgi:hypothetical protein
MATYVSVEVGLSFCDICHQLLTDWGDAERVLLNAESVLMAAQTANAEEFSKCCLVMWKARRQSDDARLVFELHRMTHAAASCWPVEMKTEDRALGS